MLAKRVKVTLTKTDYLQAPFLMFSRLVLDELRCFRLYGLQMNVSRMKTLLHYLIRAKKVSKILLEDYHRYCTDRDSVFVYGHFLTDFTLAAAMNKDVMKSKIVARLHGADLYFEREQNNYLPFRNYLFNQSEKFFFISQGGANYFQKRLHLSAEQCMSKTEVNYLGVQNPQSREQNTRSAKGSISIVTNSWTVPLKRIELVIEAMRLIPQEIQVSWTHFGDHGFTFYDYHTQLVQAWIALQKDFPNVKVHQKGSVTRSEIFRFYHENTVDLFINTSSTEGIPITMMEAMSFAVPVLGTRVGGVPEIIEDTMNGFLLNQNTTPQEIANRILEVYRLTDDAYLNMSRKAYQTWFNKFNSEINEIAFMKAIES